MSDIEDALEEAVHGKIETECQKDGLISDAIADALDEHKEEIVRVVGTWLTSPAGRTFLAREFGIRDQVS